MQSAKILEVNQLILKFIWKGKGPRRVKTIFKRRNRVGGFTSYFKTDYKIRTVIRTLWYGIRRATDQQNRTRVQI